MTNSPKDRLIAKLSKDAVEKVDEWRRLDAEIEKLTTDRDAIKDELVRILQSRGALIGTYRSQPIVEFNHWERTTFDVKRFRADHPEMVARYRKRNQGDRLEYVS